jgi:HAD superfamily hydrolase (TIGR01509 family)
VLDFDGTILDTERPLYQAWSEVWDAHGHQLALADWQKNIGTEDVFDPMRELERRLGRALHPDVNDRRQDRRDQIQARYRPRAGVVRWLVEAHDSGVPVGIASSSPRAWVEGHLTRLGLRGYFACLVCTDSEVPAKPAPISYLLACERLGADPSRSVAVEDSPHGVAAAVAAGLFTVAVPHELTVDLDLSAADLVSDSLEHLDLTETLARATARAEQGSVHPGPPSGSSAGGVRPDGRRTASEP